MIHRGAPLLKRRKGKENRKEKIKRKIKVKSKKRREWVKKRGMERGFVWEFGEGNGSF